MAEQQPNPLNTIITSTTVPSSTLTPTPSSPSAKPPPPPLPTPSDPSPAGPKLNIAIPSPSAAAADDAALVRTVTDLINAVYLETEMNIFHAKYQRTDPSTISSLIRAGELAIASIIPSPSCSPSPSPPSPSSPPSNSNPNPHNTKIIIGCVHIKRLSPTHGEAGMLAVDPTYRSGGHGRELLKFAEAYCREKLGLETMRLTLLVPRGYEHAFKMRLQAWYERLGYKVTGVRDFGLDYPELKGELAGETDYRVFEKGLVDG
ncbi:hypothetical protein F4778DRAFT_348891 [Xylariomycetidae sp. FL2044]|nr:hypothetical protein F4778DRAFT_348891 [Xylariomycetidae sp. FL2044]